MTREKRLLSPLMSLLPARMFVGGSGSRGGHVSESTKEPKKIETTPYV